MRLFDGELDKLRLVPGDQLIVEGNGSQAEIGRMALWEGQMADCVHQNHIIRVRLGDAALPEFVAAFWNSVDGAAAAFKVASSTSGLFTLSTRKIRNIEIPLPPLEQQTRIIEELDRLTVPINSQMVQIETSLRRASRMRQSVLRQAFSGRLAADCD